MVNVYFKYWKTVKLEKETMSGIQNAEQLIKQLQKELELKSQALYDCERQKKTAEALVLECQEEIRVLQSEGTVQNAKLEEKIHQLEENNLSIKDSYSERLSYLEGELTLKDEEINALKSELHDIIKVSERRQSSDDDILLEEISCLRENNIKLEIEVEDLTKICELKEIEITSLQDINMQLKDEVENYKEILECKKGELDEAKTVIQTLKDDYIIVKSELDSISSKPLDDKSRGNSLFAEVDDRRVQLQQNMNLMKTKYLEMKRERASHLKQVATLQNENAKLLARWESEILEQKDDEDMILQSYINQVRTLNEIIESYQKESREDKSYEENSMKFFDKLLNSKNQEIQSLKQKLSSNSLNETLLSHDLADARRQNRKQKLEISKLQNDIGQLKVEIEELKLVKAAENIFSTIEMVSDARDLVLTEGEVKPIIKKDGKIDEEIEVINLDETNKENNSNTVDRKVKFTENTIDPRVTDRSKYRRGAKILETKSVHVSSLPKRIN